MSTVAELLLSSISDIYGVAVAVFENYITIAGLLRSSTSDRYAASKIVFNRENLVA